MEADEATLLLDLDDAVAHLAAKTSLIEARRQRRPPITQKMRQKRKEPPGNRAAPSSGRIVPTEAKPSELSGCIVGAGDRSVKNKSEAM